MFARICRSEDEETVVMESQASTNCANLIVRRRRIDFPANPLRAGSASFGRTNFMSVSNVRQKKYQPSHAALRARVNPYNRLAIRQR
jgi:hypothetical protein